MTSHQLWDRKVARLPDRGVLLFATDLQGNYADYQALKDLYQRADDAGEEPFLLLCGDLVHGPSPDLGDPADWPEHLGDFYRDESARLIRDYMDFATRARTVSLLGNHEHAHIGGPRVSKFHNDEAMALDDVLGDGRSEVHDFMRRFPLIAVARCGARFTHGAPRLTAPDLDAFERLDYAGYERVAMHDMYDRDTLGALLWARSASPEAARAFLRGTALADQPGAFIAYGHDVVREGFDKIGDEQICLSTSYGLYNRNKVYLRLDLGHRYRSVHDLNIGAEILPLYPRHQ